MTESYAQWYERHSPPGKILATQYTSADPIRYNGSLVYPMYSEEFGTPGARLAMTALSAAPPAGLRGWGIGLSVLDGHLRFDGRRLGGIDVWGDALATGLSIELAGNSAEALFTLTPVWVDDRGVQKSWEGNYGILVEHLPDGRVTLWCSVGEGPPNFANLVVEISTRALDAEPAAPQENEAQLLDDQYVTLPVRYRAERPDGGRVVLVDTAEVPDAPEAKAARRGGGWVSRRDYAPPADGSAGRWDRQAPAESAVRRPSGELPPVPEGLGEESPFGPGVGADVVAPAKGGPGFGAQGAGSGRDAGQSVEQGLGRVPVRRGDAAGAGQVPSGGEAPQFGRRSPESDSGGAGSGRQAAATAPAAGAGTDERAASVPVGGRADSPVAGFGRGPAERRPEAERQAEQRRAGAGGFELGEPSRPAAGEPVPGGRGERRAESGTEAVAPSGRRAEFGSEAAAESGRRVESGPVAAAESGRRVESDSEAVAKSGRQGDEPSRNDRKRAGGQHALPTRAGRRPDIRESRYGQRPTAAGEKLTGRHGQGRPPATGARPSAPGANLAAGLHGMRGDESDQRRESFAARLQALRGDRAAGTAAARGGHKEELGATAPQTGSGQVADAAPPGVGGRPQAAATGAAAPAPRGGERPTRAAPGSGSTARQPGQTPSGVGTSAPVAQGRQRPSEGRESTPGPRSADGQQTSVPAGTSAPRAEGRQSTTARSSTASQSGATPDTTAAGGSTASQGGATPDRAAAGGSTASQSGATPDRAAAGSNTASQGRAAPDTTTAGSSTVSQSGAAPDRAAAGTDAYRQPEQAARGGEAAGARPEERRGGIASGGSAVAVPGGVRSEAGSIAPQAGSPNPGVTDAGAAARGAGMRPNPAAPDAGTPTPRVDTRPVQEVADGGAAPPQAVRPPRKVAPRPGAAGPGAGAQEATDRPTPQTADANPAPGQAAPIETRTADRSATRATDRSAPDPADRAGPQQLDRNAPRPADQAGAQQGANRSTPRPADQDAPQRVDREAPPQADRDVPPSADRNTQPQADRTTDPNTPGEQPPGFGGWSAATLQHNPDTLPPRRSVYGPPPVPRGQGGIIGDPGYRGALYDLGLAMYRRGDTGSARGLLTQAAEAGHVAAAYDLGSLLRDEGDTTGAEAWWRAAAAHGEPRAAASLKELREGGKTTRE
ncbi:hypothetical protein [Nocardia harenae]|uniref:hypothetical protein n=1 Tax=Nocardia harenae TaxID=358707 RepID=UPI00082B3B96|nr:hypothetical protein [Nocardia harenae]